MSFHYPDVTIGPEHIFAHIMKEVVFTVAQTKLRYIFLHRGETITSDQKKSYRLKIVSLLPKGYLPLHASIITNGKRTIIITGVSGAGKSTLSEFFKNKGYHIYANDFVVAWIEDGKVYASDLNYLEINKKKEKLQVDMAILLDPKDPRDVFAANKYDLSSFYHKSLSPLTKKTTQKFTNTKVFSTLFENHIALGNRISIYRWGKLIDRLVFKKKDYSSVGIIGVGTIGQDIANLLLTKNWVKQIHLYSRNYNKLLSLAKDFKSASDLQEIYVHHKIDQVLKNSDIVVLCFRSETLDTPLGNVVPERKIRLYSHTEIIWQISRAIRGCNFTGHVLVVTNPVDILSWCLYYFSNLDDSLTADWSGLCSNQIYGVGLGLDYQRLKTISIEKLDLVGEHGENLLLTKKIKNELCPYDEPNILHKVKEYSTIVRRHAERTRFGPTHEILRIIEQIHNPTTKETRYSTLNDEGCFLGNTVVINKYRLPQILYKSSYELKKLLVKIEKEQIEAYNDIINYLTKKMTPSITERGKI